MMKIVYPKIWGGLGNQMFVYAAARAHSLRAGADLLLNVGALLDDTMYRRKYSLDIFAMEPRIAKVHSAKVRKLLDAHKERLPRWFGAYRREREEFGVNPLPRNWLGKLWLSGYWQSEGYFADYADIIRTDFTLKNASLIRNSEIGRQIETSDNSVFVHVRSFHEAVGSKDDSRVLPLAYYENAMRHLLSRIDGALTFFLFSDETEFALQWLKSIVNKLGVVVIPVRGASIASPGADLQLMRMCRHAIVGNSSFSWWGAWLGEQDNKVNGRSGVVVCPEGTPFPGANRDFYPKRWPRISRLIDGRMCYDAIVAWDDEDGCVVHQLDVRGLVYSYLPREFSSDELWKVKRGCSNAKTILVVVAYNCNLPANLKQRMDEIRNSFSDAEITFKVMLFDSPFTSSSENIPMVVSIRRAMSAYDTEYTSAEWSFLDALIGLQRPLVGNNRFLYKIYRSIEKKALSVGIGSLRQLVGS